MIKLVKSKDDGQILRLNAPWREKNHIVLQIRRKQFTSLERKSG